MTQSSLLTLSTKLDSKRLLCVYSLYQPYQITFKAANTNMLHIDLALEWSLILFLNISLVSLFPFSELVCNLTCWQLDISLWLGFVQT
jgi:hypothetical protein